MFHARGCQRLAPAPAWRQRHNALDSAGRGSHPGRVILTIVRLTTHIDLRMKGHPR